MTGNQLKILALVAMTLDHIGVILLPQVYALRVIGRLAFPIFAYMIAEGCFYTRNKAKYLGLMCALGLACQLVYWFALGSLEQSILTTFALGMLIIFSVQWAEKQVRSSDGTAGLAAFALPLGVAACCAVVCYAAPSIVGHGFRIDYGFMGVLLPLWTYLPRLRMSREDARSETAEQARKRRMQALMFTAVGLLCLSLSMLDSMYGVQWWCLAALVPLALYNGKRGTWPLKYLFYVYYPLHLVVIYGISMLV